MGYRVDALPRTTDAHVIVRVGATAAQRGLGLLVAYEQAKAFTPGGAALSATNRATVLLPPGRYDLPELTGVPALDLDASFVSLVGMGSRDDTIITSSGGNGMGATLAQTARDIQLRRLTICNAGTLVGNHALQPMATQIHTGTCDTVDAGAQTMVSVAGIETGALVDDWFYLTGGDPGVVAGWHRAETVAAGYIMVAGNLGAHTGVTFTSYRSMKASFYKGCAFYTGGAPGGSKTASPVRSLNFHIDGTWEDCWSGTGGWLAGDDCEVCVTMRRCQGLTHCVGWDIPGVDVSGLFIDCDMGDYAFGGCTHFGADVSGTFYNCRAGKLSWATGETFSGAAYNCRGGAHCFCQSSDGYLGTFSGYAENCVTSGKGFSSGFAGGKLTGRLLRCRCTEMSTPIYLDDAEGGARVEDCVLEVTTTNIDVLYLNDSASVIRGSTLLVVEGGTGFPINAGAAVNAVVDHCRMNNFDKGADYQDGLNANVTNLVANPYNSVDSDIAY